MSNIYTSRYPSIKTDTRPNSAIESVLKKLTVEEYYDLKHHTHDIDSLVTVDGSMTFTELQTTVVGLTELVNNLNTVLPEQNDIIQEQKNIINKMEADTTELKQLINLQNETINTIKAELDNVASISDWNVEKPGVQDINDNDLGELMGFKMTEITE